MHSSKRLLAGFGKRVWTCLHQALLSSTLFIGYILTPNAIADIESTLDIHIKSQDLTSSLIELGKQAQISLIITATPPSENTLAPEISGLMSPLEAIKILLQESGLSYHIISPKIISISIAPKIESTLDTSKPKTQEYMHVLGYKLTGSNIRRINAEDDIAPLDIISNTEIERSGSETLADLIKFIPAVSGNSTSTSVSNGGDGTTKVTLRGLPANNTLVLINGQRVAFDGLAGDSVDLNTIAPAAIERLEILKDGASAIYGSDAIAGVINIAMKESFDGIRVAQYLGQSSRNDIKTKSTSILFGKEGERHNGLLAITHYQQDGLFSRDREVSASADNRAQGGADRRSSATPMTRLTDINGNALILDTDDNGEALAGTSPEHFRAATSEDLFDFRSQTSSISPSERLGFYANLTNTMSEAWQLKSFVLASNTDALITLASAPLYTAFNDEPVTVSAENRYNPFDENIADIRRRVIELAPRTQRNESRNYHLNSVLEYLKPRFEWSTGFYWNQTQANERLSNLIDGSKLALALGPDSACQTITTNACVPLNLFGPPGSISSEQLAYISTDRRAKGSSSIYGANTSISGALPAHEGNRILYATGMDWRREESEFIPDELLRDNLIGGVFQTATSGQREVIEVYGELLVPLITDMPLAKQLDLELAARYTESSDYGDNIAPKMGLKYRPFDDIMLRSTLSSGFRAPSIKELYTDGGRSFAALFDPCALEENVGQLEGCAQQSDASLNQFLTEYSGFSELKPEESTNFTLGVYITPTRLPGFTFSADAFSIRQKNVIDANPQTIVDENARSGTFADLVFRDSNGNITLIKAPFINIGERHIQGADFHAEYDLKNAGLKFNLSASYLHRFINKLNTFTEEEDLAGTFQDSAESGNGSLPHWKINLGWVLKKTKYEWSYNINYVSPLNETFQTDIIEYRTVGQWLTHNTQIQYSPKKEKKINFILGMDNIFDQAPPFSASAFNDNHDSRTYNLKGRFLYAKVSFSLD